MLPHKADNIRRMLTRIGVPRDGVLLVHSAFKPFNRDGYDAPAVLETLMDYMAPGTLLLPTMSWRFVKPDHPFFDEVETPSNTGVLTELFRTNHMQRRSLHPTHSAAGIGNGLEELLGTHHQCITPCGADSPYGKLAGADAFVVLMGITMDCCTLIHHVEEMVAPDIYCRGEDEIETYTCRARDGDEKKVQLRRHKFLPRDYFQFQDALAERDKLRISTCDSVVCRGFRAADMAAILHETLTRRPDALIARPGQRYRMM